jgi:hypothetical protein
MKVLLSIKPQFVEEIFIELKSQKGNEWANI